MKLSKLFFVVDQIKKTTTTFKELLASPFPESLAMVIKTMTPLMMDLLGGMMFKKMKKKEKKMKKKMKKKMTHQVCFYFL